MEFTDKEEAGLAVAALCLDGLREYLQTQSTPALNASPEEWFGVLMNVKSILGNFNNLSSFVACLLAKDYLTHHLPMTAFDVAEKPQGANGLDIDELTLSGARVIGEIKTTTPRQADKIEAEQMKSFYRDFAKLQNTAAEHKFMFVTHSRTYDALLKRSQFFLSGVTLVCLTTGDECAVPTAIPSVSV